MRYLGYLVIGLGALAVVGAATACQHKTPEQRADWVAKKVARELDLNDAQRAKLDEVKAAFLSARSQMESEHEAMFDEVLAQVRGERLDEPKLLKLFEVHQARAAQLAPSVLTKIGEFHAGLTPEQKAKAAEEIAEFRKKHHRR